MIKIIHTSPWLPDYVADNILGLDSVTLKASGVTHIVFDLDNTLVLKGTNSITGEYQRCIENLRDAGFTVLIGSNSRRNITSLSSQLGVEAVQAKGISMKPTRAFYGRVIGAAQTSPSHMAMVGDHIIFDVFGGNRAGLTTVLVGTMQQKTPLLVRWYMRYALKHNGHSPV